MILGHEFQFTKPLMPGWYRLERGASDIPGIGYIVSWCENGSEKFRHYENVKAISEKKLRVAKLIFGADVIYYTLNFSDIIFAYQEGGKDVEL